MKATNPVSRKGKTPTRTSRSAKSVKKDVAHSCAFTPDSIRAIAESFRELNQRAVLEYAPIVGAILRTRSRNIDHIEHTLDGLVSFCGYEPALQLFKRLCRHYYSIDPAATAAHVNMYREMWDSDEVAKKSVQEKRAEK